MADKLYVLVRRDLSPSQQAVQAGHALAEHLLRGDLNGWDNGTLILLGVGNEQELQDWAERLTWRGLSYSMFREPDIGDQMTALACAPSPEDRKLFRSLKLI